MSDTGSWIKMELRDIRKNLPSIFVRRFMIPNPSSVTDANVA